MNGQRQEPDDGRLSRPVPWERRGEVPLRDPITPINELNDKSDLVVSVDYVKKGRSIVILHFQFKEDKKIKMAIYVFQADPI
ncbi:hypothetical protein [Xenorhabdus nematophila]|uniref:hypothetical protein n=1 Tax=Xenorhabdus nematophila TaxID=628 RepID=UPI002D792EDE|nr:hypothetical protein [Xenorhabdus nematophila]